MTHLLDLLQNDGRCLEYVKAQTEELCIAALSNNGLALEFVLEKSPEMCMLAVRQNGFAIQYTNQTKALCMAALANDALSLQYIKAPDDEMERFAVQINGFAIQFVREQTVALCKLALDQNPHVLMHMNMNKHELSIYAVSKDLNVLKYIENKDKTGILIQSALGLIGTIKYAR